MTELKKYNICDQCSLATYGCEKKAVKHDCFYAATHEECLVCPYCGHKIDEWYELSELGLFECSEVYAILHCDKCNNPMYVNSTPKYYIDASPADESAVQRLGHSDYR